MQDILKHVYEENQLVNIEVDGQVFHALLTFLKQVTEQNTFVGFSHSYSKAAKEVKSPDGKVITDITLTRENYPSLNSYMSQEAGKFTGILGVIAEEMFLKFSDAHIKNIKDGTAKEQGKFKIEKEDASPLKLA